MHLSIRLGSTLFIYLLTHVFIYYVYLCVYICIYVFFTKLFLTIVCCMTETRNHGDMGKLIIIMTPLAFIYIYSVFGLL